MIGRVYVHIYTCIILRRVMEPREQARLQEVDLEVTYAYILMYVGIHNNSDLLGTSATPYHYNILVFVCLCFLVRISRSA